MEFLALNFMGIDLWQPLAGLGLFLFAMDIIESALERVSGQSFQRFLRRNTHNPIRGVLSGTAATALLQSSSLVGLLMLALVGAGVVSMRNALSVMFGANLGTTATGWLVATFGFKLDLDALALPLIAGGAFVALAWSTTRGPSQHTKPWVQWGRLVFGIGLLLLGLEFMKGAVGDVSGAVRQDALAHMAPLQFLAFGVVFSALVQSSSATMMVTLAALHAGVIDLPAAAAVAIGADLGTTSTVWLGALRGSAAKKRVAAGHVLFNVVTDSLAFALLQPLLSFVLLLGLTDVLALVAFHSIFNLLGILIFLPLIGRFAAWLEGRFRDSHPTINRHLANTSVALQETATEAIELEATHLINRVIQQNLLAPEPPITLRTPSQRQTPPDVGRDFASAYAATKQLEGEIIEFAADAGFGSDRHELNDRIRRALFAVREAIHAAKNLKDVRENFITFHRSSRPTVVSYGGRFRHLLKDFSGQLMALDPQATRIDEIFELQRRAQHEHDELHDAIMADVHSDRLRASEVSSLLNVNRELINANQAMLTAVAMARLSAEQVATLEMLPSPAG